jgi:hypothetical protein
MRRSVLLALAAVVAIPLWPQTSDPLLNRIRSTVSHHLSAMPNYTCLATFELEYHRVRDKQFSLLERVRYEVAYADGQELFAWPGASSFVEHDLSNLIGPGNETGDFAMNAHAIYEADGPVFTYVGQTTLDGRAVEHFRFTVTRANSSYLVSSVADKVAAGYHGDIWNDAKTFEIRRIDMIIDDIPPEIPVRKITKRLDYAHLAVGANAHALPAQSESVILQTDGNELRLRTAFASYHQYRGESKLILDADPASTQPAAPAAPTGPLPAGLTLKLKLVSPIDISTAARGDLTSWEVDDDARLDGHTVLARGAKVELRIAQLNCSGTWRAPCLIEFNPVRAGLTRPFTAELTAPALRAESTESVVFSGMTREVNQRPMVAPSRTDVAGELARGRQVNNAVLLNNRNGRMPAGFTTRWRTR